MPKPPNNAILIADLPEAQTQLEQATVLRSLPKASLLEMMKDKAQKMDVGWFRTMVQGGLLDVHCQLDTLKTEDDMTALCNQWTERSITLTSFIHNVNLVSHVDTLNPKADSIYVAVFHASDDFKAVVVEAAERMVFSHEALCSHDAFSQTALTHPDVASCMGQWMAAACIIDLPHQVRALASSSPLGISTQIGLSDVAPVFYDDVLEVETPYGDKYVEDGSDSVYVTPLFCALQFSRKECMDVLLDAGASENLLLGKFYREGRYTPFNVSTMQSVFAPICEPQALAHVLKRVMNDTDENTDESVKDDLISQALDILTPERHAMHPYVSAYIDAGVYDIDPCGSINEAIANGHASVIDHFKGRVPWDDFEKHTLFSNPRSPIIRCAEIESNENAPMDLENAILAIMDQAIEAGKADIVFTLFEVTRPHSEKGMNNVVEPMASLCECGYFRAVVKFLEHGIDPNAVLSRQGVSILERADAKSPEAAHLIRTFMARKTALSLMQDMDGSDAFASAKKVSFSPS